MAEAKTIFEGKESDVGVEPVVVNEKGRRYERVNRAVDFWNAEEYIRRGDQWVRIEAPLDSRIATLRGQLILQLKTDWKPAGVTYKSGSLIAANLDDFLGGKREFETIFPPRERGALQNYTPTPDPPLLHIPHKAKGPVGGARREARKRGGRGGPAPPPATPG